MSEKSHVSRKSLPVAKLPKMCVYSSMEERPSISHTIVAKDILKAVGFMSLVDAKVSPHLKQNAATFKPQTVYTPTSSRGVRPIPAMSA